MNERNEKKPNVSISIIKLANIYRLLHTLRLFEEYKPLEFLKSA